MIRREYRLRVRSAAGTWLTVSIIVRARTFEACYEVARRYAHTAFPSDFRGHHACRLETGIFPGKVFASTAAPTSKH